MSVPVETGKFEIQRMVLGIKLNIPIDQNFFLTLISMIYLKKPQFIQIFQRNV